MRSGWLSGVSAAHWGAPGWARSCVFRFPEFLTTPDAGHSIRCLTFVPFCHVVLVLAFGLGALSLSLRRNKALAVRPRSWRHSSAGGACDGELRAGPLSAASE